MQIMKKISILSLIMLFCFIQAKATEFESLYTKYKHKQKAENMKISSPFIRLASLFTPDSNKNAAFLKALNSLQMLNLNSCTEEIRYEFSEDAESLKMSKYEVLVDANNANERTRIFAKQDNKLIKELIIIQTGKENLLIKINGKFDPQNLTGEINQKNIMFDYSDKSTKQKE